MRKKQKINPAHMKKQINEVATFYAGLAACMCADRGTEFSARDARNFKDILTECIYDWLQNQEITSDTVALKVADVLRDDAPTTGFDAVMKQMTKDLPEWFAKVKF